MFVCSTFELHCNVLVCVLIKSLKVVMLEDLAAQFKIKTQVIMCASL